MILPTLAPRFTGSHLGEFLPPLLVCAAYLFAYARRARTLAAAGRPVARWRALSFATGTITAAVIQLPPLDTLADQVFVVHMLQHIVLGDICSLLIVLGLTGPVLAPLLRIRLTRRLRMLAQPIPAFALWMVNLYAWHLPVLYELAIRVDLVHALEHASLLWFGSLLWLALIGPLPKPSWFVSSGRLVYIAAVRVAGAVLGNVFIWTQTVVYPTYANTDAARGLAPLSDQGLAGAAMMIEQMILTTVVLGWLFIRYVNRDGERQELLDRAARQGIAVSQARAARAAEAGTARRLGDRLLDPRRATRPPRRSR